MERAFLVSSSVCATVCGDGKRAGREACDDNNTVSWDGCASNCSYLEAGWECSGLGMLETANCSSVCGDGLVVGAERCNISGHSSSIVGCQSGGCDDGNLIDGDGCSKECQVEDGFDCVGGSAQSPDSCYSNAALTAELQEIYEEEYQYRLLFNKELSEQSINSFN